MIWSEEMISTLNVLARNGVPNKEIAERLHLPIEKVYAKRSQLGITIDKVALEQTKTGKDRAIDTAVEQDIEIRQKKELLHKLRPVIALWCSEADDIQLADRGEAVRVRYVNGAVKVINIAADSLRAVVLDVVERV